MQPEPWREDAGADVLDTCFVHILFVTSTRIGDAVLSTGLLDHLLRAYPAARFTIACGPLAEGVFTRMPRRERTIVLQRRPWRWHWFDLWRETVGRHWDLVIDLRGSALGWTLRAERRVVARGGRRPGHRVGHLGALLGLSPPPLPVAWIGAQDQARAAGLMPGAGPWLGIGPTANWGPKVWPAERFIELYRALTAPGAPLAGARTVVLGGPGAQERVMAAPVLAALGERAVDLVGSLELPEVAAVLARCAMFVGNDSGLMHMAAATGTPTLGLFGPSEVTEYGPAGRSTAVAVSPTSPALDSMLQLTLAHALAAAGGLLGTAPVRASSQTLVMSHAANRATS
jgi:heptosyltransferase III